MTTLHEAAMRLALEALEDSHQNINPKRGFADELKKQIEAAIEALKAALAQQGEPVAGFTEAQFDQVLRERDLYHEAADELAAQIAAITGEDIGEHSNMNDPWRNAMLAADDFIAGQIRGLLAQQDEYCAMVKLWKQTNGQAGWPAYNGEVVCK